MKSIEKFRKIYKSVYRKEISKEEAKKQMKQLVNLYKAVYLHGDRKSKNKTKNHHDR